MTYLIVFCVPFENDEVGFLATEVVLLVVTFAFDFDFESTLWLSSDVFVADDCNFNLELDLFKIWPLILGIFDDILALVTT